VKFLVFALIQSGCWLAFSTVAAAEEPKLIQDIRAIPQTIEGFLESSAFTPDLRSNFLALRKSISLQPSTAQLPRIISYGSGRKLILSFNGGLPGQHDQLSGENRSLEIMFYNEADKAFDFFHVTFGRSKEVAVEIDGPNPESCLECHVSRQTFLRPNDPDILNAEELAALEKSVRNAEAKSPLQRYKNLYFPKQN
jgi:hypothetical protein